MCICHIFKLWVWKRKEGREINHCTGFSPTRTMCSWDKSKPIALFCIHINLCIHVTWSNQIFNLYVIYIVRVCVCVCRCGCVCTSTRAPFYIIHNGIHILSGWSLSLTLWVIFSQYNQQLHLHGLILWCSLLAVSGQYQVGWISRLMSST